MTPASDSIEPRSAWREAGVRLALVSLAGMIVYAGLYLATTAGPRDWSGHIVGRDFVNTWMGARAVLNHQVDALLNVDAHNRLLKAMLGPMPPHNWSYPPTLLLFLWPLGFLGYLPALAAWSAAGYAAYVGAAATHARSPQYLLFVAASPIIAINLYSGQTGLFTAAILILYFRFLDERPLVAGALLGLMMMKPQLVVLFPLALALNRRWRVFAAAGASVTMLVAATALVFGCHIWAEYFHLVTPVQRGVMEYGTGFLTMMPTAFMHARLLGLPLKIAWMVQAPFTILAVAAIVWTFARRRNPLLSAAILLTAAVLASPYSFNYDMVVFGWLIAMLWPRLPGWRERGLLVVIWTLPLTMVAAGEAHLPVAAPILAIFLIRLVVLTRRAEAQLPS